MTTISIDTTLARISAIQARMVAVGVLPARGVVTPSAGASSMIGGTAASGAASGLTAATDPAFAAALSAQAGGGVTGGQVVASAEKYLAVPYVFGGTSNSGLDCSGLVQKAYGDLGISLPRVAADQAHAGTAVASLAQAQPGDVLAFGDPA